jgi:hypothetical protein
MKKNIGTMRFGAGLGLLLACTASINASISITIDMTYQSDANGVFSPGQSSTVTFDIADNFDPANSATVFTPGTSISWDQTSPSHDALFSAVTSPDFGGTLAAIAVPMYNLSVNFVDEQMTIAVCDGEMQGIGLTAGASSIWYLGAFSSYAGLDFQDPGSTVAPSAYFLDYLGTYTAETPVYLGMYSSAGESTFSLNSISISQTGAVPEPSLWGFLLGGLGLGFAFWYRRRRLRS